MKLKSITKVINIQQDSILVLLENIIKDVVRKHRMSFETSTK